MVTACNWPVQLNHVSDHLHACERWPWQTQAEGSGVICVAIVGGAVIPPLTGKVADITGSLQIALIVPALCYLMILAFGLYAHRRRAFA